LTGKRFPHLGLRISYDGADYLGFQRQARGKTIQAELERALLILLKSKHQFLFLPTANENFGHSIVESLFSGCPAIISNQTPWNDLQNANAGYALNLDDKAVWTKTIEDCSAMTNDAYQKASKNAQSYISEKINLPLIKQNYIQLFNA